MEKFLLVDFLAVDLLALDLLLLQKWANLEMKFLHKSIDGTLSFPHESISSCVMCDSFPLIQFKNDFLLNTSTPDRRDKVVRDKD